MRHYDSWANETLTAPQDLSADQLELIESLYKAGDPRAIGGVANTLLRKDISEELRTALEAMVEKYRRDSQFRLRNLESMPDPYASKYSNPIIYASSPEQVSTSQTPRAALERGITQRRIQITCTSTGRKRMRYGKY